jgi:DNA polymerase elongation subunit (family B)
MQHNISPETLDPKCVVDVPLGRQEIPTRMVELLADDIDTSILKQKDRTMTANGVCYRRDKLGLLPEVISQVLEDRKTTKKEMLRLDNENQTKKDPEIANRVAALKVRQEGLKILANALYGATANAYFRFYDTRIAEGITVTGQFIVRRVQACLNEELNKMFKTTGVDYAFYADTDSCYITLDTLVEKYYASLPAEKLVDVLDKIVEQRITPIIEKATDSIADYLNAYQKKIVFKREAIAVSGIWTAKKRYALLVWDLEGVRYPEPVVKITGLETNRSTTPGLIREELKKAVRLCLEKNETDLQEFVEAQRQSFMKARVEDISFPKGINGCRKYASGLTTYISGTPMHVRASLIFNSLLEKHNLTHKYPAIQDGDKIKYVYLMEPNPIGENVIGFSTDLPKELGLHPYVDYNLMFEKTFVAPLKNILKSVAWNTEPQPSLDAFFD